MSKGIARLGIWGVSLVFLLAMGVGVHVFLDKPLGILRDRVAMVPPGAGMAKIAEVFFEDRHLESVAFKLYVLGTGQSRRLKAGEYALDRDSIRSLVQKLVAGKVHIYRVTMAEGLWASDIVNLLSSSGLGDKDRFLQLIHDPAFARRLLGFDAPGLEGYLFPETYFFTKTMSEEDILRTLVRRFQKKTDGVLTPESTHAVVTLASMVERESAVAEERPVIAAVFLNRIKKHMPLESCVTVEYAIGKKKKHLWEKDLMVDSPYNTYRHQGLPPGPVCNPGLAAIRAAVEPAATSALFFVARGDGRHEFSKTWAEHKRAKRRIGR